MKTMDKVISMKKAMENCGKLPISLDVTQAEKIVLSQWIAKLSAATYDKGFEDGQKNEE